MSHITLPAFVNCMRMREICTIIKLVHMVIPVFNVVLIQRANGKSGLDGYTCYSLESIFWKKIL